jgi:structural maintenance of chromosome 2
MEANQRAKKKDAAIAEKKSTLEETRADIVGRQQEGAEAEKERARVEKKRDKELAKGGKLKALEDELGTLVKELARFATQAEIKEGAIADEKKKVEDLKKALEEVWYFTCPANAKAHCDLLF